MTRGLLTVASIRARCEVDAVTGCWHWQGAKSCDGVPRIWTFDHERGEKRCMCGPKAVWNIAHGRAPLPGYLVYRECVTTDCLKPSHLRASPSLAAIGANVAASGKRKGTSLEQRLANVRLAWAAAGNPKTPEHVIAAILAADPKRTHLDVGRELGIAQQTVGKYRAAARLAA